MREGGGGKEVREVGRKEGGGRVTVGGEGGREEGRKGRVRVGGEGERRSEEGREGGRGWGILCSK